ncbi:hypothetical protein LXL04_008406 [Taraxacum kok-saghyz]
MVKTKKLSILIESYDVFATQWLTIISKTMKFWPPPYMSIGVGFVLCPLILKATMTAVSDIFTVGEEVEINGLDGDEDLCFYIGTIIRLYRLTADVRFRDLKDRNGESLEGAIRMEVLRPKPPVFVYEYKSGDAVEVWMDNRWRKGRAL